MSSKAERTKLAEIRRAVADYMRSEGCSCCQLVEDHKQHKEALAKLLNVPAYEDGSGYDFGRFQTGEVGDERQSG